MSNQQLPFCFTLLSCSSSPAFRNGQIISTLNKCGLFLCHHGEIEISLENKPYLIRHGDIYIYQPSTLVRLLHKSEDAEGTIIEVDLDYVIPIANKVINAENLLFMRKHPCVSLSEEQYVHITNLLENIENRIKSENKAEMNMQRQHLMQEVDGTNILLRNIKCLFYQPAATTVATGQKRPDLPKFHVVPFPLLPQGTQCQLLRKETTYFSPLLLKHHQGKIR